MDSILALAVDDHGFVSDEARDLIFGEQFLTSENCFCMDCSARNPTWLSLTFAVYLCLNCSGRHRRFGSHISFVRSIDMDKFTREQLIRVVNGGNAKAMEFFRKNGLNRQPIDYTSQIARRYPQLLDSEIRRKSASPSLKDDDGTFCSSNSHGEDSTSENRLGVVDDSQIISKNVSTSDRFGSLGILRNSASAAHRTSGGKPGFSKRLNNMNFDALEKSIVSGASYEPTISGSQEHEEFFDADENQTKSNPMITPTYYSPGKDKFKEVIDQPDLSSFSGKTGLSSDELFGRGEYSYKAPPYNEFSLKKTSLSSDEYFGRQKKVEKWDTFEERAIHNMSELRNGLINVLKEGNKIVGKAKQWLNMGH